MYQFPFPLGVCDNPVVPHPCQFSELAALISVSQSVGCVLEINVESICISLVINHGHFSYVYGPLYDLFCEMPVQVFCPFLKIGLKENHPFNCESIHPPEQV